MNLVSLFKINRYKILLDKYLWLQIFSNATARIIYIYLISFLANINNSNSNNIAVYLGYAFGLVSLFNFNIFQYILISSAEGRFKALNSCYLQLYLFVIIQFILILLSYIVIFYGIKIPIFLSVFNICLSFSIAEILMAISTIKEIRWRPITYYGSQSIWYILILYLLLNDIDHSYIVLSISLVMLIIYILSILAINKLQIFKIKVNSPQIINEYIRRSKGILTSFPIIFVMPIIIAILEYKESTEYLPKLLLFISYSGAVVFILGNIYQYYGITIVKKILLNNNKFENTNSFYLMIALFVFCLIIAFPIGFIFNLIKIHSLEALSLKWYIGAAIVATDISSGQWISAIKLANNKNIEIFLLNLLYLFFITLPLFLNIDLIYTYIFASVLRASLQMIIISIMKN